MTRATKFTFNADFRAASRGVDEATLAAARAEAFRQGQEQGRREAQSELAGLTGLLARAAEQLLAQEAQRAAAIEAQAARLAVAAARAFAEAAIAARPLAALEEAMRECISHARTAAHLVVRVNEASLEAAEVLVGRLAGETGFQGKLVILGEPDIAPGDGRIEWADGGLVLEAGRLGEMIERKAAALFGPAG